MRTTLAALAVLLLAACGQPTPQASRSPVTGTTSAGPASPSPNEASATPPLTSPSAAAQSPSPSAAASVLSPLPSPDRSRCRIPIAPPGNVAGAGFVSYPDGAFTPDSGPKGFASAASGEPDGGWGLTYDRRFTKWLPVPPNWVAPNGASYAYGTLYGMNNPNPTNRTLHLVDVATGAEVQMAPGDWRVVGFTSAGVYVMSQSTNGPDAGLSLINVDSRVFHPITNAASWTFTTDSFAWGNVPGQPDLLKLDLASGQISDHWFSRPGMTMDALGGDAHGNLIVQATSNTDLQIWLVSEQDAGQSMEIYAGSSEGTNTLNGVYAMADGHGLWFGTQSGLYLYAYGGSVVKIAANPGQVAGPCN